MIYLDYAATTPLSKKAGEVFTHVASQYFGNASSLHDVGSSAKQIFEASAKAIAQVINANGKDVYFTSGASEANFLAIQALLDGCKKKGKHLITTKIEHASVKDVFEKLESQGFEVTWLGTNERGEILLEELKSSVREDTILVSIQHANSEIGTIQNLKEMGAFLKEEDILLHTDAVQTFGKIAIDVAGLNIDALSVSAHKIYGPKGIGAVWLNPDAEWIPFFEDHSQTKKLKTGTDNVPGAASFATATKEIVAGMAAETQRLKELRTSFLSQLNQLEHSVVVEGESPNQLPNIIGLRYPGMEGQFLMLECNQAGLAISTGSACQVGSEEPNRTMKALGRSDEEAREFVRISFGQFVKEDHLKEIIDKIDTILTRHFRKVRQNQLPSNV